MSQSDSPIALAGDSFVALESVITTAELQRRASKLPDYRAESQALVTLMEGLANSPSSILQKLADTALNLCRAHSAGITILEEENGRKIFRWHAVAGQWSGYLGSTMAREISSCGTVLDRNTDQLMSRPERHFSFPRGITPGVDEVLLIPFYLAGEVVGTIWVIAHDESRKFDAEDLRQLQTLAQFASVAYQTVVSRDALEQRGEALRQSHIKLTEHITEFRKTDTKAQEARRAALNLMEDAVQSRQAIEKLNAELRQSEERFRSLVSVITDVTWTAGPEGRFITPQTAWELYTGQAWEEHRGFGWIDAVHPEDRERIKEIWNEACSTRKTYQSEGRLWHAPTQRWRYFMAKATPLLSTDGSVREWVGTCIDCDDQKRAQETLEETVAQRTTDLQQANAALLRDMEERKKLQDELLQAQKMESIGTLAGGIAHDFNNILGIIEGYALVLSGYGSHNREIDEGLGVINETVQRGSKLVQQLLTLARKSSTNGEAVDVNGLVTELIGLMMQTFPKTIEFSSALEANLAPIIGDKNQIEQALLNLCLNARDAMPNGGKLNFRTRSVDGATLEHLGETKDKRYVCIEVNDTGKGMDEGIQKRIFEPFFTTKDIGHGTGLGLSVVYGIVENHKGFIDVDSKPESGTSFRLYFPLDDSSEEPAAKQIVKTSFETTERSNGYGTILVVEDEKNMIKLLRKVLGRHGYKILTASDGESAVDVYQHSKEAIDVVLLDLGLPKMGGREVLRKIQSKNPDVKVIIASGYLEPELKAEIDRTGVKYFVPKPYRPADVVQALQSLIKKKS